MAHNDTNESLLIRREMRPGAGEDTIMKYILCGNWNELKWFYHWCMFNYAIFSQY